MYGDVLVFSSDCVIVQQGQYGSETRVIFCNSVGHCIAQMVWSVSRWAVALAHLELVCCQREFSMGDASSWGSWGYLWSSTGSPMVCFQGTFSWQMSWLSLVFYWVGLSRLLGCCSIGWSAL